MRWLLMLASFVIVIAGLKAAQTLLAPFLIALFIAVACWPAMAFLLRHRVPASAAIALIALVLLGIVSALAAFLGRTGAQFAQRLPQYRASLRERLDAVLAWFDAHGFVLHTTGLAEALDPAAALRLAADLLAGFGSALASTFMIVLTVVFLLGEFAALPHKWRLLGKHAPDPRHVERALASVHRYLVIKGWISLITGGLVAAWLAVLGVDFPLLWGLVAVLLNFVPNIGSIIAAVPPVLLAVVQFSWWHALAVAAGYLVVNLLMGNVLEPRYLGRGVGLSTLVVFLSLVFWGWVLGPVGMLLSAPLTMIVKIALEVDERTRWIAVLLGPDPDRKAPPDDVTSRIENV